MRSLRGLTVLDISRLLPGGFASLLLSDLGARVLKIEQPGVGDYYRAALKNEPLLGDQGEVINQGKESLSLDLKSDEGREIFLKLVRKSDVILENFRPGVLKKLKMDYPRLRKINPRIILCSVTGLGQKGKTTNLAGHDINYLGLSGLLSRNRDPNGQMVIPDFQIVDLAAGYEAAMKIAAALHLRTKTKQGSWIDVSMLGAGLSLSRLYANRNPSTKPSRVAGGLVRYGVYETSDGRHVTLGALEPKFWRKFCQVIGQPTWAETAEAYEFLGEDVRAELKRIFKSKTQEEWIALGRQHDFCLFEVKALPTWKESVRRSTPRLGQHSSSILRKIGYTPAQIRTFEAKGVL